ncbi:PCI domain-containing protein 2 homolog [Anthonomus grandis grandis]|uniref:PCI domain-containing protein 2 homolog n=1 Tax=Anthonomus grandis grandis TaxID=2921223 RepID=UPI002165ACBF|nr:PCI domain-containing protein 2 homolog [Anthonomus grandis grandis]
MRFLFIFYKKKPTNLFLLLFHNKTKQTPAFLKRAIMSFMNVSNYLQVLDRAWRSCNGYTLASFLSLRHDHSKFKNYHIENPEIIVSKFLEGPLEELVIYHFKCLYAVSVEDYKTAYQIQNTLVQVFIKILQAQKEENWLLPVMYTVCSDLRILAQQTEKQKVISENPGECLEKAAESILACFRICAADNRTDDRDTKRRGMMGLVNQLFKIYFRINKVHLCKPLIRAIESSPFKETFCLSQQITYRYFVGRKAMFDSDYKAADKYLSYAFENCHKIARKNKRLILIYLVPVKMLLGYMPSRKILEKYDILEFSDLVQAVCQGNLKQFDEIMEEHESFFIDSGIYLIVDKLKIIAYRNLFKKVYLILNTHQIPVESLQAALEFLDQDVNLDETQCIVANLINDGKIKGYISHQHRKVVVSKQNPFPALTTT